MDVLFDGINIKETFNIQLAERPLISSAEMEYETVDVPGGRTLIRELGYKNTPLELRFNYIHRTNTKKTFREITNWLTNKRIIKFSDDMDVYRVITKLNVQDATNDIKEYVDFIVKLETEPFWYEDAGQVTVSDSATITNPTAIKVDAKMRINGTGTCRVLLNDNQMVFTDVQGFVDIEKKNAFRNGIGQNNSMSGQFPVLLPDKNTLSISGQTTSVVLDLRWAYR